ncbi:uncharacterized protein VTP21DRAFT_11148 [Calcarisporiella thermophila]|uniref:uncharacterized protein n=1 Tax=Calcarisporiella thermophila TaxID=911321 RepID=UPI003742C8B5
MATEFSKGLNPLSTSLDGSNLRILIVHSRWNATIVDNLVKGAIETMTGKFKVRPENIVVQSVPGSYELPFGAHRLIAASQIQAAANANDLLTSEASLLDDPTTESKPINKPSSQRDPQARTQAFDAVICIGVLIKGGTMHFEYICEAVTQGIMRVQLDTGVPVIFGVLTCLSDEQALERAGLGSGANKGHNHGEDWGAAAVEMALLKERKL